MSRRGFAWTATVIPPITGGLHCGGSYPSRSYPSRLVIPPITGGLHCGDGPAHLYRWLKLVIPPITGGLHCGPSAPGWPAPRPARHPAHYGRAPLRPLPGRAGHVERRGHPAHYGRAPLRHGDDRGGHPGRERVIPPITGGLHCGYTKHDGSVEGVEVIPPITGGLHCGKARRLIRRRRRSVIPPITGGLHCGPVKHQRDRAPRPSSRPLRAGSIAATGPGGAGTVPTVVIPPITGGLHCGAVNEEALAILRTVIPPITGGLHCGALLRGDRAAPAARHPAHYGRAPLRPCLLFPGGLTSTSSSRPLRAGSIAAC